MGASHDCFAAHGAVVGDKTCEEGAEAGDCGCHDAVEDFELGEDYGYCPVEGGVVSVFKISEVYQTKENDGDETVRDVSYSVF